VCNTGVRLTPTVRGEVFHFEHGGLYDGLFLMRDRETGSHWQHITGECLVGELTGERLPAGNLWMTTARQAVERYPAARFADSRMSFFQTIISKFMRYRMKSDARGMLPPNFRRTMGKADDRLPRLDIGLGVWTENAARFYPQKVLAARGNALIDTFDGRALLVYLDPVSGAPAAFFTPATGFQWEGNLLRLDDGAALENGQVCDADGEPQSPLQPMQLHSRWYGFAYTFPNCTIFE